MGCTPKMSHPTYGYGVQNKNDIVIARVSEGIDYLVEHNAKNYNAISRGTLQMFDPTIFPLNLVHCHESKCHMTGTLWLYSALLEGEQTNQLNRGISINYVLRSDFRTAAFGYLFFYIDYMSERESVVSVTIANLDDTEFANSYTYQVKLPAKTTPGFEIVQIGLGDYAAIVSQEGTGWTPVDDLGVRLKIDVDIAYKEDSDDVTIGLSSLKVICDKSELHKSDNVILSCLQSISPDISVDATDASCFGQQYDKDSASVEFSIEARTRSKNDFWLNPFERKGDKLVAPIPKTIVKTVEEFTAPDGTVYGRFRLQDFSEGCNSVIVSLGEECEGTYLEPLQTPILTPVDETEFVAIYQPSSPNFGEVFVNKRYINRKVLVTYDVDTQVEHFIADTDKMDSFEAEFLVPITQNTGTKEYVKFYALVTEHSTDLTNSDEASLSLTLQVVRKNGKFYDRFRLVK